ncbi:uncharacterized protein CTHT_0061270 [Thermochaetoides thermophila DSM 1495]|uniref:Uncharacterized protein n=1 Tax=Chaetomium thermophilum (strain DSM 1495 / CBS 144.50 / IMI 039719) TaxID=759272 RepID=G0SF96_CHATD|nr:hypothetical protein CTHT_0061270 [Thermochaetoides thermophila DSM 1495]EGS18112.1 hypothetical protein CTHT_0061270 [Thermochaetoides thermophila DSM 1495]
MNTVSLAAFKPMTAGWGSLCVAGGVAYYFAKQSINADRQSRLEEQRKKREMIESLEKANSQPARTDFVASPSQEAVQDPAPTRHAPTTEGQRILEKSKYEAAVPFESPKGDRFS